MAIKANEAWTMRRGYSPKPGRKASGLQPKTSDKATVRSTATGKFTSSRRNSTVRVVKP
jgi:hypothetical protein